MSPRLLLLLAMVAAFFLLLLTLVRWGETFRLRSQYRQQLAQRDSTSSIQSGRLNTPPILVGGLPPIQTPLRPVVPSAQPTAPLQFFQTRTEVASKVVTYLRQVSTLERERQQVWGTWWERALPPHAPSPDSNSQEPAPQPLQSLPLPDLLLAAAQWNHKISGSLPDSTCLPFHLAYLHYFALEKDYIQQLVLAQQQDNLAECLRLKQEQSAVLGIAAQRVQAKLRDLQREHPELSPDLREMHIGVLTEIR